MKQGIIRAAVALYVATLAGCSSSNKGGSGSETDPGFLVGGSFTGFAGYPSGRIVRLLMDGTRDTSYVTGTGFGARTYALLPNDDGTVFAFGSFTSYQGIARPGIALLKATGALDTNFAPLTGFNNDALVAVRQSDGKILVGGSFTTYEGVNRGRILRLNAHGTIDTTFTTGTSGFDGDVNAIAVQTDDKIVVGGNFLDYDGTGRTRIARLEADGSLDASFNPGLGFDDMVQEVIVEPSGKVLACGDFTTFNGGGNSRPFIARLNANGSLDTGFLPGFGFSLETHTMLRQPDGKIIVGGAFTLSNGLTTNRVGRLNADGTRDASFSVGVGPDATVWSLAWQGDKILVGGEFTKFQGSTCGGIVRIDGNGTRDTSFQCAAAFDDGEIRAFAF